MPNVKWISIEIGHVSTVMRPDYQQSHQSLADEQKAVMAAIRWAARAAWAGGGELELSADQLKTDSWAAVVLQQAINDLRMPGYPEVRIDDKLHLIGTACANATAAVQTPGLLTTGEAGTHCRLRGDRWINERSYVLYDTDSKEWLYDITLPYRLKHPHIATATLVWECRNLGPCRHSGSALPPEVPPAPPANGASPGTP